jgi:hypothetical protein
LSENLTDGVKEPLEVETRHDFHPELIGIRCPHKGCTAGRPRSPPRLERAVCSTPGSVNHGFHVYSSTHRGGAASGVTQLSPWDRERWRSTPSRLQASLNPANIAALAGQRRGVTKQAMQKPQQHSGLCWLRGKKDCQSSQVVGAFFDSLSAIGELLLICFPGALPDDTEAPAPWQAAHAR